MIPAVNSTSPRPLPTVAPTQGAGSGDDSFRGVMNGLLEQSNGAQRIADQALNDLALGRTDQLHQVMLAVAKADLTFRLTLEIRNKLMEAYQEIQRMQM